MIDELQELYDYAGLEYEQTSDIAIPKGVEGSWLQKGDKIHSVINKIHIIKLHGNYPAMEKDIPRKSNFFEAKTVTDLCKMEGYGAAHYEVEDFLYCRYIGVPINRLITLRRFPYPCTDNIIEKDIQGQPDIARMVTYSTNEVNKFEDILSFQYGMRWKELQAEMEQASMTGDQSGLSGFMKSVGTIMDATLNANAVSGRSTGGPMSQYDPKHDQNKVYGPVDSISQTNIRDVGLDFQKEFELTFDYELRSIGGRTGEFAFKDIIGNVLACTFQNAKFWGGARYWVGERPTNFARKIAYLNSDNVDEILTKATAQIKAGLKQFFGSKESALNTLKRALRGGFAVAIGKILDAVGRPGILTMNSLLSGEPTGFWHVTVGNPTNPIMAIGNLILTGVDFKFPTDTLSYGDFPTKMQVIVRLKPGMPKDRAGIETIFNHGAQRIYWAPKSVKKHQGKSVKRKYRSFLDYAAGEITSMTERAYDFIAGGVKAAGDAVSLTPSPAKTPTPSTGSKPSTVKASKLK